MVDLDFKEIRAEDLREAAHLARDKAVTVPQGEALPPKLRHREKTIQHQGSSDDRAPFEYCRNPD